MISLILTGIIFSRPMLPGYYAAAYGIAAFSVAAILSLPYCTKRGLKAVPLSENVLLINAGFAGVYCAILAISDIDNAIKTLAINGSFLIAVFLAMNAQRRHFRRLLAFFFRIIMISGIITVLLLDWNDPIYSRYGLIIVEFPIKDREGVESAYLYFPLSTIPYIMTTQFGVLLRSTFLAVEPGVAVAVIAIWRSLEKSRNVIVSLIYDLLFIACLALTVSTSGPLVAGLFFVSRAVNRERIKNKFFLMISVLILGGAAALAFLYIPGFGYLDKVETHGSSFDGRIAWFQGDRGSARMVLLLAVAVHLFYVARSVGREFINIAPILFIVSILNVLACSPLYFICSFALLLGKVRGPVAVGTVDRGYVKLSLIRPTGRLT